MKWEDMVLLYQQSRFPGSGVELFELVVESGTRQPHPPRQLAVVCPWTILEPIPQEQERQHGVRVSSQPIIEQGRLSNIVEVLERFQKRLSMDDRSTTSRVAVDGQTWMPQLEGKLSSLTERHRAWACHGSLRHEPNRPLGTDIVFKNHDPIGLVELAAGVVKPAKPIHSLPHRIERRSDSIPSSVGIVIVEAVEVVGQAMNWFRRLYYTCGTNS